MAKYVEWIEPYDKECKYTLYCRMTVEDIAAFQHAKNPGGYANDTQAVEDFIVVNWGKLIETD